ncbi:hypothetical protein [Kribbella sp. NPDC003557]|uniref:hypothetical protein n=1 Tax=Kribbella sp. NPDC003557 TaxID=3154449 RepID=UPI0033BB3C8F
MIQGDVLGAPVIALRYLTPQVMDYRFQLAKVWSDETIYESYLGLNAWPRRPSAGQCGVSSAWLSKVLAREALGRVSYCYGAVYSAKSQDIRLADHCWLELGDPQDRQRLVVDVTCDQSEYFLGLPVICDTFEQITAFWSVEYRASQRMSVEDLADDPVHARLQKLDSALLALGPGAVHCV